MFIYENDRIISRHLYSIRNTCSPFSLCIFYYKGLVFVRLMAEYLPEHLETAIISQLTFNMWVSILFHDIHNLPLDVFLCFKPKFAVLLF